RPDRRRDFRRPRARPAYRRHKVGGRHGRDHIPNGRCHPRRDEKACGLMPRARYPACALKLVNESGREFGQCRTMHETCRPKFGVVTLLAIALVTSAHAQTYPDRPVRLIVPFAAGGLNDVVARLVAPYLERSLGQPFIVDNRPAASGIVGTDAT